MNSPVDCLCLAHVKAALAQQFADWVVGPGGQQAIAAYRIGGYPLLFPNARR